MEEKEEQKEKEKEKKAEETEIAEEDEADDKKKTDQDYAEESSNLKPPFFRLPTLHVPILKDGKVAAYLHLKIEMEASSLDNFNEAKILLARLYDGIFSDLYASLSNLWVSKEDPKVDVIKERIANVCAKVLGKDKIKNVFVRQILLVRQKL